MVNETSYFEKMRPIYQLKMNENVTRIIILFMLLFDVQMIHRELSGVFVGYMDLVLSYF